MAKRTSTSVAPISSPMISVAGIRGTMGDSLRVEEFFNYAQAFLARLEPRRLILGRDTRASGEMMTHLVCAAAIAAGLEVHDLGVVPTPTVGFMVRQLKAGGGIMISASHNPPQWNAWKFFSSAGSFLSPKQLAALLEDYEKKNFRRAPINEIGRVEKVKNPLASHLKAVLTTLPVAAIRRRKFRVVLDACNGAGLDMALDLFKALGVRADVLHARQYGSFDRPPEPLPENLDALRRAVKKSRAQIGFALDPDGDRLAIVDEKGRAIGEERTVALAAEYIFMTRPKKSSPPIAVVNLSTTRAMEDVAARYGGAIHRTKIGEAHVVGRMLELNATIGGEGNGGVIYPRVHPGRDAATGMGLILALMAATPEPLSKINGVIPDYVMIKDKVELKDRNQVTRALDSIRANVKGLAKWNQGNAPEMNETDGLKVILADRWLHLRASGTEPIMRIFAEAPTDGEARGLIRWASGLLARPARTR